MSTGHWITDNTFNQDDYFGFVYQITNIVTDQSYIGKKNFRNHKGHTSDWARYTSSCKPLNKDIRNLGIHNFVFQILYLAKNNTDLSEAEIRIQTEYDVLHSLLENGNKKFYNRNIGGITFNTTGMSFTFSESHKQKLKELQKGNNNSFFGKTHTVEKKTSHSILMIELQKDFGFRAGKIHTDASNIKRRNKLQGKSPANKGKPAHNKGVKSNRKGKSVKQRIMGDSVLYSSITEAANILHLSTNSIKARCKSNNFPNWYYLD